MKSCKPLLIGTALFAQFLASSGQEASVPEVKVTPIKPEDAQDALKRLVENGVLRVIDGNVGAENEGYKRGLAKRATKNGQKARGKQQKGGGTQKHQSRQAPKEAAQRANPRQENNSRPRPPQKQGRGRGGGRAAPTGNKPGTRGAPRTPTRTGGESTQRTAPNPPSQTQRQYLDDYAIGDDTSYYDDYFVRHDDFVYQDDHYTGNGDDYYYRDDYYVGKGGSHQDDYYNIDDYNYVDDYYYGGKGKGGKKSKKHGKKSKKHGKGKGGKGGQGYYDDVHYDDRVFFDDQVFLDDPFFDDVVNNDDLMDDFFIAFDDNILDGDINVGFEAFVDTRNIGPPIFVDTSAPDEFQPGTVYVYADVPIQSFSNVDTLPMVGIAQGTCTRTDPDFLDADVFEGKGVCQLTYELFDGNTVIASFQAEGTVQTGTSTVLTITGGLGIFQAATGQVTLIPVTLDSTTSAGVGGVPTLDGSIDFLSSEEGYYMFANVYVNYRAIITDDNFIDDNLTDDGFTDDGFTDTINDDLFPTPAESFAPTGAPQPSASLSPTSVTISAFSPDGSVLCEGMEPLDYCDCLADGDCRYNPENRCPCAQAQACCGF